ncbi:uncharacterized protein HGUI_03552 [Hanseniaspora guilliermondii]|uniref:HMG box domain-containing protein n=1 Tax=Hanseniaspora guilliermondii TaxID=56406 RepID=A0A1L0D2H7_9ASCO|nr:uncharacterized protein HGUI_03552 [Hanseniaspora guilliermondii]
MSADHKFKLAKDSLVSSLFELSKAASRSASSILDFYHCIQDENYDLDQAFLTLQQSLALLGQGTAQLENVVGEFGDKAGFKLLDVSGDGDGSILDDGSKKKKLKKDPFAPKKPLTIFFAYTAYIRDTIKQDRIDKGLPPLTQIELTKTISQMWRDLDEEQKEKWRLSYNHELEVYNKRKQAYLEAKEKGISINFNDPVALKNEGYLDDVVDKNQATGLEDDVQHDSTDIATLGSGDANGSPSLSVNVALGNKRSLEDDEAEKKKKKKKAKKAEKKKKAAAAAAAAAATTN